MKNLHKSLYINERYNILKDCKNTDVDNNSIDFWRRNISIISESSFNTMLKINRYEKSTFSNAVNYSPSRRLIKKYNEYVRYMDWYKSFEKAINNNYKKTKLNNEINVAVKPFINYIKNKLFEHIKDNNYPFINEEKSFVLTITSQLENVLSNFSMKATILEINKWKNNNDLTGVNSEDRYKYFLEELQKKDNLINFYDEYIVLARQLSESTNYFYNYVKEILQNINNDINELENFTEIKPLSLKTIVFGEGDTHSKGKTVCILEFSDCKLIYKPKNLKINNSISKIIEYFNHKDKNISIKIPKSINKSEYTYEEFIKQIECKNENELKKFYYHYGQLLGFVYYFNGNDFHLENLIAHKSHPIIVDYETMLQQAVHEYFTIDDEEIVNSLFNRVSRTLLLPTKGSGNNNLNHVEMSALNGKFRKNAFLALQVINEGTDKIKYDYIPLDFNGSNNLPTRDENFDICLYRKEIKKGFQNFSETLLKYKNSKDFKELCKDVLENNKARILLRDTNQYGVIISHMYHPDFLKDMLDREKILENMWGFPYPNKGIIYSEVEQMKKSDIPIFYFTTSEKYIFDDFNNKYEGILKDTSFNYFEKNIENLNMSEVEKQCEIIDVLYPDFYSKIREKNLHNDDNDDNENFKTQIDYEEELFKIANKIIDTSLSKRNPLWLYPENYEGDKWTLKLTDMSFYKGIPGIFLFFNYLCRYSSNSKYKSFYDNLVNNIPDEVIIENHEIGLNSNLGYFYAISLIDDYGKYKLKFVRYIKKVLNEMEKIDLKEIDNYTDYINGALPFINSLIRLYKIGIDRKQTLSLIIKFADHLHYLVGKSDVQSMPTSFGHGIEGVIFTLKNVYRITDIYKYKKTLDYLNDSKEKKSTVEDLTWCNGALGKIINKDEQLEHSNISILDNDCLCHGNLGIVDILAENIMNKQEKDTIDFILRKIISYKNKNGRYKLFDTTYFPDTTLFCGITGIGFTLLKVLSKGKIPSVLKI